MIDGSPKGTRPSRKSQGKPHAVVAASLVVGLLVFSTIIALSIRGTPVGSETQANAYTTGDQGDPAAAIGPNGDIVVVWESDGQDGSGYGIHARVFYSTGLPRTGEIQVNSVTSGDQRHPSVEYSGSGSFIVTWQSHGDYWDGLSYTTDGIYKRSFTAAGTAIEAAEVLVNSVTIGNQTSPDIGVSNTGRHVIVWADELADGDGSAVLAKRYGAGAQPPQLIQVNTRTSGSQAEPATEMSDDGSFVVVWRSDGQDGDQGGIYTQAYSGGGATQGSERIVNTFTAGDQSSPAIAMNSTGAYIVGWASEGQDGDGLGVYCQMFTRDHTVLGSEFRANTAFSGDQTDASLAMTPDGAFIVVWTSDNEDGSGRGIFAQQYTASGSPAGAEFRVNTFSVGGQQHPCVHAGQTGGFVIAWDSEQQDGDLLGVFIQIYDSTPIPEFSELVVAVSMTALLVILLRRHRCAHRGRGDTDSRDR